MSIDEMNKLLHKEIPLCKFMQMQLSALSDTSIAARAPLTPNRNMHQTGFAGSLYALAVATGWAMAHHRQAYFDLEGVLVVKDAHMHYKRPVTGDIELKAELSDEAIAINLKQQLEETGRTTLPLEIWVYSKGKKCAYLEAGYVVVPE